jgi:hypothetical protein
MIADKYQITVDERSRNTGFVELVAPFFMVNAVLDELEFTPDDFFSGPSYFQVEVQLADPVMGRVQEGRKPIFVEANTRN